MKRCFVALVLPETTALALTRLQDALLTPLGAGNGVRPVPRANLHVTLHFLGDVQAGRLPGITAALAALARSTKPLQATAVGVGVFGATRIKSLHTFVGERHGAVVDLMAAVDAALATAGLAPGRHPARVPHVTLARFGQGGLAANAAPFVLSPDCPVHGPLDGSGMVLFESRLDPAGAVYLPLVRLPFAAG